MTETNGVPGEGGPGGAAVTPPVAPPARLDVQRAFDIYVFGRSRNIGPEAKGAVVGGVVAEPVARPPREGLAAEAGVPARRVPVPEALSFERNAGTWRRRGGSPKEGPRSA